MRIGGFLHFQVDICKIDGDKIKVFGTLSNSILKKLFFEKRNLK